jgi:6-phosphogluconolactonase
MTTVVLTGGRAAEAIYRYWAVAPEFQRLEGVRWLLGDERCVPCDHPLSNHRMVLECLFPAGIPASHRFEALFPTAQAIEAALFDGTMTAESMIEDAVKRLGAAVTAPVECLLLSVGDDGHVASLFPGAPALRERHRCVVAVERAPKPPPRRLTITPPVIARARRLVVLAHGPAKAGVRRRALQTTDADSCPARLALHGRWLCSDDLPGMAADALCELLNAVNQ